jgi:hypothetical protein
MQVVRRKLIKGAIAASAATLAGCGGGGGGGGSNNGGGGGSGANSSSAPSTFSLRSPEQAWASAGQCIARGAEQARQDPPLALTDSEDTYVRGTLEIKEISDNGKVIPGDFFADGSGRYWQIEAGGSSAEPTNFLVGQPGIADRNKATKQALLNLDERGEIVSTVFEDKGGSIMTRTCATSLATRRRV